MIRALMHGALGAMGHVITDMAADNTKLEIVAGVDINTDSTYSYPVYKSLYDVKEDVDVIIDFCNAKAIDGLLDFIEEKHIPTVLCTTGLSDAQIERVAKLSKDAPILRSGNMSLGINLLEKLAAEAAKVLFNAGFDIEILEMHHHRKLDAPSGTAIMLADSINKSLGGDMEYIYDRHTRHEARDRKQIGISSVRAGSIVGEHDIIFAGEDEVITLKHEAHSRRIFAAGAIAAAAFLYDKKSGLYTMSDVV